MPVNPWLILLVYDSMDKLLHDPEALAETFAVYRELIRYFVVSNNPHASDMRTHMRGHNHGSFMSSLYRDLCDICSYCGTTRNAESLDHSAESDLRGVLLCLSSLVLLSDILQVSLRASADVCSQCTQTYIQDRVSSAQPPANQLEAFRKHTSAGTINIRATINFIGYTSMLFWNN
jgi:hypothetical protein